MDEIISFYDKTLKERDCKDLSDVVIENLKYLADTKLDNSMIIDIWAQLLALLLKYNIFKFSDLTMRPVISYI